MKKTVDENDRKTASLIDRRSFMNFGASMATATLALDAVGPADAQTTVAASSGTSSKKRLGSLEVSPVGLGCMTMVGSYNPASNRADMVRVIHSAHDSGVTFFDTAEFYGPRTSEELVGEALQPIRDQVVLASKFGYEWDGKRLLGLNSKPAHIRKAVEGMLQRLRTDHIDLLYMHRKDPEVPMADIAGMVGDLIREGKAREFGVSEVSPDTLRVAHAVTPVAAVQNEYSLLERLPEVAMLDTCAELGIGLVTWSPTMRALLTDHLNEWSRFAPEDRRSSVRFFTPEALKTNMGVVRLARKWAERKGTTPAQFSLAWLMAQRPFIVPIPGTIKLRHVRENLAAADVTFTQEELKEFRGELEALPVVGNRPKSAAYKDD